MNTLVPSVNPSSLFAPCAEVLVVVEGETSSGSIHRSSVILHMRYPLFDAMLGHCNLSFLKLKPNALPVRRVLSKLGMFDMRRNRRALVRIAKYAELLHIFDQCDAEIDSCSALGLVQRNQVSGVLFRIRKKTPWIANLSQVLFEIWDSL